MLTIFTAPKPFTGRIERLQNNAVTSWLALNPEAQIILVGDEEGTDRAAARLGVEHAQDVERNEQGTPLVSDVFRQAERLARHPLLCYVNADIILLQDFMVGVQSVESALDRFLMVGRRWDVEVAREFSPEEFTDSELGQRLLSGARPHPPGGSDYFVFRAGEFTDIPPFAMGRAGWDNWMIYAGRARGIPVVDASADVKILHQDHDYAHLPGGQPHYRLPESEENVRLAGGREMMFRLTDADWRLEGGEVRKERWPWPGFFRWLETALVCRFGPGRVSRLVRMALHPWDTLRYYVRRLRGAERPGRSGAAEGSPEGRGRIPHPKQERSP